MTDTSSASASVTAEKRERETEVVIKLPNLAGLVPDEFMIHMRRSWKEQLLAARSLLDAAIDRVDRADDEGARRGPRRVDIKID